MSAFGKTGRRCDKCGKISKGQPTGEYTRKDHTVGYIWPDMDEHNNQLSTDTCDDCLELSSSTSVTT